MSWDRYVNLSVTMEPVFKHINPYPNTFLWYLDSFTLLLMRIGSADTFVSCFIWTTEELKTPWRRMFYAMLAAPLYLAFFLAFYPITFIAFLLWLTFQHKKTPYRRIERINLLPYHRTVKDTYGFATMNLCLLVECLARFNNNSDNAGRAKEIGRRLKTQQMRVHINTGDEKRNSTSNDTYHTTYHSDANKNNIDMQNRGTSGNVLQGKAQDFNHSVLEEFPAVDVLIIQEAFMPHCTRSLASDLLHVFPFIVYDVGVHSWTSNKYVFVGHAITFLHACITL